MLDGSRAVRVRFNDVGMRGPNHPAKKPDEKRVLFLGDSMTFGPGLEEDEAFPAQFARQATTAWGVTVTAGNAAAPSLGTRDFAPFVRRVRTAFAPDLIVAVVYLGNDFFDNFAHDRTVIDGYPMDVWAARLAKTSWRARLCLRYGVAWKIETWLIGNLPAVAMDTSRGKKSAAEEASQARVAAICGRLGLPHIDVTTVLRQQPDAAASFLSHNMHLSARGCETIAAALVEALR